MVFQELCPAPRDGTDQLDWSGIHRRGRRCCPTGCSAGGRGAGQDAHAPHLMQIQARLGEDNLP
jgi:hypothetical protein